MSRCLDTPFLDTTSHCTAFGCMAQVKPKSFADFQGQERAKKQLAYSLEAAKLGKAMPHILLNGPAGVGKTTLAELIALELGTHCKVVDALAIKTIQDFIGLVSDLQHNDVLFVDEIHGLSAHVEEQMYAIVTEFTYTAFVNKQPYRIQLPQFVLIGATTKMGEITAPLRTRFGIVAQLEYYDERTLAEMAVGNAAIMGLLITDHAAYLLAHAARGTARILNNMLDRADDIGRVWGTKLIDTEMAQMVLCNFGVDVLGLNSTDRNFLRAIKHTYQNQPVGLSTLAATLGENEDTLSEAVEPFLLRRGFLQKTPRGRILTARGLEVAA